MRTVSLHKTALIILLIAIILALSAGLWLRHWYWQATDLSAVPPSQSFTRVLGLPVPSGVSELKIAGTAHLSGIVWMRFKVANAASFLEELRHHGYVVEAIEEFSINARGAGESPYAARVEWEKSLLAAKPRYYRFHREPLGTGWAGGDAHRPRSKNYLPPRLFVLKWNDS